MDGRWWLIMGLTGCVSTSDGPASTRPDAPATATQLSESGPLDTDAGESGQVDTGRWRDTGDAVVTADTALATDTATSTEPLVDLAFDEQPALSANPDPMAPLTWILTAATNLPTRATLTLSDPVETRIVHFDDLATSHDLDVLALRPEVSNHVVLTVTAEDGQTLTSPSFAVTPPRHALADTLFVERAQPARMEPGYTLIQHRRTLLLVDEEANVRWAWGPHPDSRYVPSEIHQTPDGHIRMLLEHRIARTGAEIREIDMRGEIVRSWRTAEHAEGAQIPIDMAALHHDVRSTADGGLLAVEIEARSITDYPASETDLELREEAMVVGDVINELDLDGTVRHEWALLDLLDPRRVGYDSVSKPSIWDDVLGTETRDWSHTNGVFPDPARDGVLVSVRHQDAVLHIDRATGELDWILGPHANWGPDHQHLLLTPIGDDFAWSYHQHAVNVDDEGTVFVFDNGNYRASPPDPHLPHEDNDTSRAVAYNVDPVAMTVEQVWSFEASLYSPVQGNAHPLPQTGHVLVTYASIARAEDGRGARVFQVTRQPEPEVVFELALETDIPLYRARHLASPWPSDVRVERP